jgi:hypothetical protein
VRVSRLDNLEAHPTPDERNRAVRIAKDLRADPLATGIQSDREWLMKWLIEVPDISVKLCGGLMGDLGDSKKSQNPGALLAVVLASQAAFVIENPQKAKDNRAIYLAGIDGALDAYQAIRSKDSSYQAKRLDEFTRQRSNGKLVDAVSSALKENKCK